VLPAHTVPPLALRRLPIRVEPRPGEAFAGWIERLAAEIGAPIGVVLDACGLGVDGSAPGPRSPYGVALAPGHLANLAGALNLPPARIEATLLSAYDGTALDLAGLDPLVPATTAPVGARQWAIFKGSRLCPACLAEDGTWHLAWKLSTSAVCPRHRVLLEDSCPACGIGIRVGSVSVPNPAFPSRIPDPLVCSNPAGGGKGHRSPCGASLVRIPTVGIAGWPRVVAAQETLDWAAAGHPVTLAGHVATASAYFSAVRSLVALVRALAQPDDLGDLPPAALESFCAECGERDRTRSPGLGMAAASYRDKPPTAGLAAALIPVVVESLGDPDRLSSLVSLLAERGAKSNKPGWRARGRRLDLAEPVRSAWQEALASKVGFSALPRLRPAGLSLDPASIPELAPEAIYGAGFASMLSGTSEPIGRAFAALALARLAGATTWAGAGSFLGMDPDRQARLSVHLPTRLAAAGFRESFWTAVRAWGDELTRDPHRPHYGVRREALRGLTSIEGGVWRQMCALAGVRTGRSAAKARNAAVWVWAEVTGGDWRFSPPLTAVDTRPAGSTPDGRSVRSCLHDDYVRFCIHRLPALRPHLEAYARELAAKADQTRAAA